MKTKPVRVALASLVAVLSMLGVAQVSSAQGSVVADRQWCC